MASTEKVSLSLDVGALLLARRAAAIEGLALSAYMSRLLMSNVWASELPRGPSAEEDAAVHRTVELDEREEAYWRGESEQRAAG